MAAVAPFERSDSAVDPHAGLAGAARTGDGAAQLVEEAAPVQEPGQLVGTRPGIAQLDALVVSDDDSDHAGGAVSVLSGLPVAALYTSIPQTHPT